MKSLKLAAGRWGVALLATAVMLAGCEPLALTAAGVGMSTGVGHTLSGITYRTFTAPLPRVRQASVAALNRMSIKVTSRNRIEGGDLIRAKSGDRDIEIELEAISSNTTRMKAVAKKGPLYDTATALEIILQTERAMSST